ncbi:MAG: hypothetical protein J5871_06200 [Bacteroidales bacterium]|nr:hypothetical protein [Bacteroidales bacterium]
MAGRPHTRIVQVFLGFLLLWGTRFLSYADWNYDVMGRLSYGVYGLLVVWTACMARRMPAGKPLAWLAVALLLGMLPCAVCKPFVSGESPLSERAALVEAPAFLVFFLFYAYRMRPRQIMDVFTVLGLFILAVQVVQVLFPDSAVFGTYTDADYTKNVTGLAEVRNGLYRFRLESYMITLLCLFYYWNRLLVRPDGKTILLFAAFAISVYLYLTRQLMGVAFAAIMVSGFFTRNRRARLVSYVLAAAFLFLLLRYFDVLFSDMAADTQKDMSENNIRLSALAFYWLRIVESPLSLLFGNGHVAELDVWQESFRFYPSDIGIVGEWYFYGACWVLLYLLTLVLLGRYRRYIPLYIKLFVLATGLSAVMIFPYRGGYEFVVWATMLYIVSYSIRRKAPRPVRRRVPGPLPQEGETLQSA